VLGGQRQFIALLGQGRQFEVGAEVVAAHGDGALPTLDSSGQRGVDVLKGLFGRDGGRPTELANAVEHPPGFGLLFGLVCQESELHGHLTVSRVDFHGAPELLARQFVLAHFQIGVGQVLANGSTTGSELYRLLEQ